MKISKKYKIHNALSTDEMRPALTQALYDKVGKRLVATTGHIIAVVPVEPSEGDRARTIPSVALKEALKGKQIEDAVILADKYVTVGDTTFKEEDDKKSFPSWEGCFPDKETKVHFDVGLNAKLLFDLSKAIGSETVRLTFSDDPCKPIKVEPDDTDNNQAYGLIMPLKLAYYNRTHV